MHIADGIVSAPVAIAGYGILGGLNWYSLRQVKKLPQYQEQIPRAALLTAAFFLVSLIHIPLPFGSIHLIFNGLLGIVLGYLAFPAIVIGLFFQTILFNHGGLSTLGLNSIIMGLPALAIAMVFHWGYPHRGKRRFWLQFWAFMAGFGALMSSALLFSAIVIFNLPMALNPQQEYVAIALGLGTYGLQAILEGVLTVILINFFQRVKPELLDAWA